MTNHKCNGCRYKGEHQEMGFVPFGVCLLEHNLIQAEKNYNAEKCPFMTNGEDIKEALQSVAEEMNKDDQKEKVEFSKDDLAIQEAVQAIQELQKNIMAVLFPILESVIQALKRFCDTVLYTYPYKRVVRLALYHPKERVRKKNMRRIMRWIERNGKKR